MKKTFLIMLTIVLSILFTTSVAAASIARWQFDEGNSFIAYDSVGSHNATITNASGDVAWTSEGPVGDGSLTLGNPGDEVVVNDGGFFELNGDFTIATWFKPAEISDRIILSKTGSWTDIYSKGYLLRTDGWGRKLMWYAGGGSVFDDSVFLYGLEQNKWYHLVAIRDGNEAKLYVNGMLVGSKSGLAPVTYTGTNDLMFGSVDNGPGWSFSSHFDQVEIYNHALEQGEIDSLYSPYMADPTEPFSAEFLYSNTLDTLRVQGYADLPAISAEIRFIDGTGVYTNTSVCVPVDQDANPEYETTFTSVSAWNKDTYNLEVVFYEQTACAGSEMTETAYGGSFDALRVIWIEEQLVLLNQTIQSLNSTLEDNLTAIWDELDTVNVDLDLVEGEINNLWDALNAHNHATINLQYRDDNHPSTPNTLRVWGEGPLGAEKFEILIRPANATDYFSSGLQPVTLVGTNENSYNYFVNLTGFDPYQYHVVVKFYDNNDDWMGGYNVGDLFDDLLLQWLSDREHGFKFMESRTFETFQQSESFGRSIVWGLTPEDGDDYSVQLVTYWTDNAHNQSLTQNLAECQWFQGNYLNQFFNTLYLPATWPIADGGEGTYKAYLIATPCGDGEEYVSNTFSIELDDIADPWPLYGVYPVSVLPGSGNLAEDVYWTNNPVVQMSGLLGNGTDWMNNEECNVLSYVPSYNLWQSFGQWPFDNSSKETCTGSIDLSTHAPTDGLTYDIKICAEPVSGQTECGYLTFGLDTTPPVIDEESLNPGILDAVHGVWNFSADVTDDGVVRYVEFWLTNKTDANDTCYLGMANNTHDDVWLVQYDTMGNCTPDGYYNFTVNAEDYAGNFATLTIDPMIDNTPPEVVNVTMNGSVGVGFLIESLITDNLAGVASAEAELLAYYCSGWEEESCTLSWCIEYQNQEPTYECDIAVDDYECFNACMETGDSETCAAECPPQTYETCEELCGEDTGCLSECYGIFCEAVYETALDCNHSTVCDEIEGSSVQDCIDNGIADCEVQCEGNQECYGSCVGDVNAGCSQNHCDFGDVSGDVNHEINCEQNCFADMDCEVRAYADMDPIVVPLTLTEGDALSGTWTGSLDGLDLNNGVHYEVSVHATDYAGNENEEPASYPSFFSDESYLVGVTTSVSEVQQGVSFNVGGAVVGSDGSMPSAPKTVSLDPFGTTLELFAGLYSDAYLLNDVGEQLITVTYTPDAACPDRSFTGEATIAVTAAPNGGGGGGGGGSYCQDGYDEVDGRCVKDEDPVRPPLESKSGGNTEEINVDSDGNGGNTQENSTDEPEEPASTPAGDDLITGAATGGGILASMAWLWILLGVVVLLLGLWYVVKKN